MYNTSNHSFSTHKKANKRILKLCTSLTQNDGKNVTVPNKKTPNLKGRTTNGQNWRHITVYKHCFCYSNFYGVEQKNLLLRTNPLPFIRSGTFQKRKIIDQKWWKIRFGSELTNSCCFAMATERCCQDRIVALKYEIKLLH